MRISGIREDFVEETTPVVALDSDCFKRMMPLHISEESQRLPTSQNAHSSLLAIANAIRRKCTFCAIAGKDNSD